jgi:O-antigen/teichoic acid export membrane protein
MKEKMTNFSIRDVISNFLLMLVGQNPRALRLFKESFWVIFSQLIGVIGMLLTINILSTRLDPSQYGTYSLFLTIGALMNSFFLGGISSGIPRFYTLITGNHKKNSYLYSAYFLCLKAFLFEIVFLTVISIIFLAVGHSENLSLVWIVVLFSTISSFNLIINDIYNIARHRSKITLMLFIEQSFRITFMLFAIYYFGNHVIVVMVSFLISTIITLLLNINLLKKIFKDFRFSRFPVNMEIKEWQIKIFKYSIPLSFVGLLSWFQSFSDRWALDFFSTSSNVGFYSILFQLGFTSSNLIIGVINAMISPIIYQKTGDLNDLEQNKKVHLIIWRTVFFCFLVLLFFFMISFFLHKFIFFVFVSSLYASVSYLLPWLILAGGLFSISQLLLTKLSAEFKSGKILYIKILAAVILILFNSIGAYFYELNGVVIALTCASFINLGIISLHTFKVYS